MKQPNQKPSRAKKFKLSAKAQEKLNKYLAEIRRGIFNVCELHTHDEKPSMTKEVFEETYIDHLLGQVATAVSLSIKAMAEGLQAQTEEEVKALMQDATAPAENKDAKQEELK